MIKDYSVTKLLLLKMGIRGDKISMTQSFIWRETKKTKHSGPFAPIPKMPQSWALFYLHKKYKNLLNDVYPFLHSIWFQCFWKVLFLFLALFARAGMGWTPLSLQYVGVELQIPVTNGFLFSSVFQAPSETQKYLQFIPWAKFLCLQNLEKHSIKNYSKSLAINFSIAVLAFMWL